MFEHARTREFLDTLNSTNTRRSYELALAQFFGLCGKPPGRVKPADVVAFKQHLESGGRSTSTVLTYLSAVRSLFQYLTRADYIPKDPTRALKRQKPEAKPTRALSQPEIKKLLAAPDRNTKKGRRDRALIRFMYATGARVSEVLSVRDENFHERGGHLYVDFRRKGGAWTKQAVWIPAKVRKALEAHAGRFGAWESGRVFDLTAEGVRYALGKYAEQIADQDKKEGKEQGKKKDKKKAAALRITPHQLRASCLTAMGERGASLAQIQAQAGHASPTTTERYLDPERVAPINAIAARKFNPMG